MSTALYDKGREGFAIGAFNWSSGGDNFKVICVDAADYSVNLATHDFLDDVTGAGIVATSANLASLTSTLGVCDAADITFSSVTGDQFEALVIYKDTGGASSTNRLVCYIDSYTGLPCTPNGGNITVAWPNDSNKIFKL